MKVTVVRILTYHGDPKWVKDTLKKSYVQSVVRMGGVSISSRIDMTIPASFEKELKEV